MHTKRLLASCLLLCLFSCRPGALQLSSLHNWQIVIAGNADPAERYAAEEFQSLFKQISGNLLEITTQAEQSTGIICIGLSKTVAEKSPDFSIAELVDEGLAMRITKDVIVIAGAEPRSTLYGVYEFFERYAGVRFLTFDHTFIPAQALESRVPCEDFSYQPPFSFRWSYYKENSDHPEFAARLHINTVTPDEKLGGNTPQYLINHSLFRQLPVEKYGKSHPEYFALVNGERKLEAEGGGPQVCVSNPAVVRIVADSVLAELARTPYLKNISVSQNDNDAYCRCPACEAINQREGTPMGSHLAFINNVAEIVGQKYPDVKIGTLAYWYTRKPPKTIKPRDNVQIQLCSIECCTMHPIQDSSCAKNREFCNDLAEWKKICRDIWMWHYNTDFSFYDLPFPNLHAIGPNVEYFSKNNVKGVFMQANGNGNGGEMCDLRNYVISHCLWHPGLNSWELVQEFCRLHYAESSQPIIDYLQYVHDTAQDAKEHPSCFAKPPELGLNREVVQKMFDYFKQALALAKSDQVRSRVEKASIPVYRAMIEAGGRWQFTNGKYRTQYPAGYENVIEEYLTLCKKHHMTMPNERTTLQEYEEKLRKQNEGIPASRFENDIWQLTLIPENSGQVVEWLHKPTGRQLLAGATQNLYRGTFEERGRRGVLHREPQPYSVRINGSTLIMEDRQPGKWLYQRTIVLSAGHLDRIACKARLTHLSGKPATYQFLVHPEFDIQTRNALQDSIIIFSRAQHWQRTLQNIKPEERSVQQDVQDASSGAFAFFNPQAGFGMLAESDPGQSLTPRVYLNKPAGQLNLEWLTPVYELKKRETLSFKYAFQLLGNAPKLE